jgi:hypothetical protein
MAATLVAALLAAPALAQGTGDGTAEVPDLSGAVTSGQVEGSTGGRMDADAAADPDSVSPGRAADLRDDRKDTAAAPSDGNVEGASAREGTGTAGDPAGLD